MIHAHTHTSIYNRTSLMVYLCNPLKSVYHRQDTRERERET